MSLGKSVFVRTHVRNRLFLPEPWKIPAAPCNSENPWPGFPETIEDSLAAPSTEIGLPADFPNAAAGPIGSRTSVRSHGGRGGCSEIFQTIRSAGTKEEERGGDGAIAWDVEVDTEEKQEKKEEDAGILSKAEHFTAARSALVMENPPAAPRN